VQGVGFRPFVYRVAAEEGLDGYVLNDEHGVLLEVEGAAASVRRFLRRLSDDAPPLARVDHVSCHPLVPRRERGFKILASVTQGVPDAPVTPDTGTCADCLSELLDPSDRRYRYPFINCTNCGPRFSIVRGVPYDRPLTSMAPFVMCEQCQREYEDPLDRRFHAQPNACPRCGPRVRVLSGDANATPLPPPPGLDAVAWVARQLGDGAIAAVKGVGGYHLVCDAAQEDAVAALRSRKHREARPFALMTPDLAAAGRLVAVGEQEAALMAAARRPIVLVPRRPEAPVAESVAPGSPDLGVMLPYTPLHHLLIRDFAAGKATGAAGPGDGDRPAALVVTSGNISDEPICFRDEDALERLASIADLFLVHDREIETRTDDSVMRTATVAGRRRPLPIRRSRGYVPSDLPLPIPAARPILACGAQQKNTFCLAKGARAWVGHHIGDLDHFTTLQAFREGIVHFERLFAVTPEVVAHDLHPDYLSTAYALERDGVELIGVQHHHAHLAACLAEHGLADEAAVGAIFDGTGFGPDGTIWGGELLTGGLTGFERSGRLWPVPMPGGTAAIRQPWRMTFAWLAEAWGDVPPLPVRLRGQVDERRWEMMSQIAASPAVSPITSSVGRLFDAVGALCGLAPEASYEGQAAIELEAAAWRGAAAGTIAPGEGYEIAVGTGADQDWVLDPRAAIRRAVSQLEEGAGADLVAARFHAGLAAAAAAAVSRIAAARDLDLVVLSGGVFQNRLLLETMAGAFTRSGLRVLVPELLPPNDGGVAFGQAAIAAAMTRT
jgi:hydrogenase maturation protein HypF